MVLDQCSIILKSLDLVSLVVAVAVCNYFPRIFCSRWGSNVQRVRPIVSVPQRAVLPQAEEAALRVRRSFALVFKNRIKIRIDRTGARLVIVCFRPWWRWSTTRKSSSTGPGTKTTCAPRTRRTKTIPWWRRNASDSSRFVNVRCLDATSMSPSYKANKKTTTTNPRYDILYFLRWNLDFFCIHSHETNLPFFFF